MSMDKIRQELVKQTRSYYDLKTNSKYLVYFKLDSPSSMTIRATNGSQVWSSALESTRESLSAIGEALKTDSFDLNSLVDAASGHDLLEFKTTSGGEQHRVVMQPLEYSSVEIKTLLFTLADKLTRLETEMSKIQSKAAETTTSTTTTTTTTATTTSEPLQGDTNVNNKTLGAKNQVPLRKPGMSLINPLTKRKKTPKGVKFDEENENDNRNDEDQSNSSESNEPTSVKFGRTLSNVSSQSQND